MKPDGHLSASERHLRDVITAYENAITKIQHAMDFQRFIIVGLLADRGSSFTMDSDVARAKGKDYSLTFNADGSITVATNPEVTNGEKEAAQEEEALLTDPDPDPQ